MVSVTSYWFRWCADESIWEPANYHWPIGQVLNLLMVDIFLLIAYHLLTRLMFDRSGATGAEADSECTRVAVALWPCADWVANKVRTHPGDTGGGLGRRHGGCGRLGSTREWRLIYVALRWEKGLPIKYARTQEIRAEDWVGATGAVADLGCTRVAFAMWPSAGRKGCP
jgi:hypothetical protein